MKNDNAIRYAAIVKLYHTHSRDEWMRARQAMADEVGDDEMERLSDEYEAGFEGECEAVEGRREEVMYR